MAGVTLRPYQQSALAQVRRNLRDISRRGVLWMPTGGGKTKATVYGLSAPWLAHSTRNRLVWLVERRALIGQAQRDLETAGYRTECLWAGAKPRPTGRAQAYVASVQSLESNDHLRHMFEAMLGDRRTMVVSDEVHALIGRQAYQQWAGDTGESTWLGLTATVHTNGPIGLADRYDWLATGPSYADMMTHPDPGVTEAYGRPMSALVPFRYRVPGQALTVRTDGLRVTHSGEWDEDQLAEQAEHEDLVDALLRWSLQEAPTGRRVVFCVRVAHARMVAERAEAMGLRSAVVAGRAEDTRQAGRRRTRDAIFADLEAGRLDLVASCDALSRGWDSPSVEVGLMLRPWRRALSAYIQQAGRLARPCADWKDLAVLLDAAGNIERWGTLAMQPVPVYDDMMSRGTRGAADDEPLPRMRRCPACGELVDATLTECSCGHRWEVALAPTIAAPDTFEGADPDLSGCRGLEGRLSEFERRRLWYARELARAVREGTPPWVVDSRAREAFGVRKIDPKWRYRVLYGGIPTAGQRAEYIEWVKRCEPMRRGAYAKKRSPGGWIAEMCRREL